MFSWYKYLIVNLVFSYLGFWSGNLFLIASFPDLCLLVPFLIAQFPDHCLVVLFISVYNQISSVSRTDSTKYKVRGYNGLLCPTNHVSNDQGYTLPAMNDQQIYGRVQLNRIFKL